ncbi:ComEC/Rec2 family competence protein [Acinetobacter terrestris]|uniref:ComEC/Rec2 family competence protein n=1 Tax=Acinetobacter terrestris TaxID=2529843 RepID=UPI003525F03A
MKKICSKLYALPAREGDCLLFQFQNGDGEYRHILIDGGNRTQLDFNNLKKSILEILKDSGSGQIDLAIVTHSDDDHISGILKILADAQLNHLVKKIWFNAEKTINCFFKTDSGNTQKYKVITAGNRTAKSSRIQDNDLYNILDQDERWQKDLIKVGISENIDNLKITVLSPSIEKLQKLNSYWPTQKQRTVKSSGKKGFDYGVPYQEFKKNMPKFEEDSSPVNGASIALLLEWESKRFLLLSDAHPSVIVDTLQDMYGESLPIDIEVLKISHHGSSKNTSDDLLNAVNCKNFIVSANANRRHYHPNKEALSRVLINKGIENTNFYFTYFNNELKKIFSDESTVNLFFPTNQEKGVCLKYEHENSR